MDSVSANRILNTVGLRLREMTIEQACDDIKNDKREGDKVIVLPEGMGREGYDYTDVVIILLEARLFGGVPYADYQAGVR